MRKRLLCGAGGERESRGRTELFFLDSKSGYWPPSTTAATTKAFDLPEVSTTTKHYPEYTSEPSSTHLMEGTVRDMRRSFRDSRHISKNFQVIQTAAREHSTANTPVPSLCSSAPAQRRRLASTSRKADWIVSNGIDRLAMDRQAGVSRQHRVGRARRRGERSECVLLLQGLLLRWRRYKYESEGNICGAPSPLEPRKQFSPGRGDRGREGAVPSQHQYRTQRHATTPCASWCMGQDHLRLLSSWIGSQCFR